MDSATVCNGMLSKTQTDRMLEVPRQQEILYINKLGSDTSMRCKWEMLYRIQSLGKTVFLFPLLLLKPNHSCDSVTPPGDRSIPVLIERTLSCVVYILIIIISISIIRQKILLLRTSYQKQTLLIPRAISNQRERHS